MSKISQKVNNSKYKYEENYVKSVLNLARIYNQYKINEIMGDMDIPTYLSIVYHIIESQKK